MTISGEEWDGRYFDQVRLLVEVLSFLGDEPAFALKGGSAINLFERDLPRLSVDIDLAWLPARTFEEDAREIGETLDRIAERLRLNLAGAQVHGSGSGETGTTRLIVARGRARIQVETTPVMRGTVHPVRRMPVRPAVEDLFGFAEMQVLDFPDLYGGKMAAALSRRHPRDLFDLGPMLDDDRADRRLWRTALVYLICGTRPIHELLEPRVPDDFRATFDVHFRGMTTKPVEADDLIRNLDRLLARMMSWMDAPSREFLWSVEEGRPEFDLIGLGHAERLPGVQRKLLNLGRRSATKREADRAALEAVLARYADPGSWR